MIPPISPHLRCRENANLIGNLGKRKKFLKRPKTKEQEVSLETIFGPGGWLASHHPSYEHRPAQLEMAELIDSALRGGHHAVAEAGTGTGKTLAYLVPILLSGQRVVISAATKNLQEQLYFKDIAFLRKLFPKLRATLMKGRSNYLCRQKVYDMVDEPFLNGLEEVDQFAKIRKWEKRTETGDRAELDFEPSSAAHPSKPSSASGTLSAKATGK